jgi:hypothetical protein
MQHSNITDGNSLLEEVKINLNMLSTLTLDWIGGHVDCTDIVAIYQCGAPGGGGGLQLQKKLAQPSGLCHSIGHRAILGFYA